MTALDIAADFRELSLRLAVVEQLLADSVQEDDPRLRTVESLEISLEVLVELTLLSRRLKTHLSTVKPVTTIAEIQQQVANHFGIPVIEMKSPRKSRDVSRPRQLAMYLARELTGQSTVVIAAKFGGRDHSTVIHAIKRVKKLTADQPEYARIVADIRRGIGS